jgi:hypothetical protein
MGEADPRARGDNAQPLGVAPSVQLTYGLTCATKHDVGGRPARFSRMRGVPQDRGTDFVIENRLGSDNIRSGC